MAFTWQFESENCVVIHITGHVVYQDIIDFLSEIKKDFSLHPEIYELVLCSEDLHVELASEAAQLVAEKLKENLAFHESGALAFVCATDHIFGLCRQLGMRVERDNMPVDAFRTEAKAREWFEEIKFLDTV
jgi:hypothetical protein